ncbi:MAG: acetolactate synthase [Hyphomicrobiales bacterium]|nr:acetolactate synthase [Hyphomicrobiales bacterium]
MESHRAADALVETLIANGLDTVYGLPGVHNDPLYDAFWRQKNRLRTLHTRHEQGAAYMALGAALATGKPQAFAVVPGPGFLNAGAALLTAYGMNAPVLALVGQIPQAAIDRGLGQLHEIPDQVGLARHITKFAARIDAPHEAAPLAEAALTAALSGRRRPVMLECAMDVWGKPTPRAEPGLARPLKPPVDEDAAEAMAKILGASKKPLIVLGGGAEDAGPEILQLAELLEAPVVGYRRGQGIVSARHRLSVKLPVAHKLWREADVVLGIGTRLLIGQNEWGLDKDLEILRIDIDPEEPNRFAKAAGALVADAVDGVRALLKRLPKHLGERESREDEIAAHKAAFAGQIAALEPQMSFVQAMRNALPDDGIFVDEVTQLGFASRLALPVYAPRTFLSPGYQDNLGWGYGTALGAQAAMPDRAVLSIAGDGGFMYQVQELATAVLHDLPVVVVVFDNGAFGNVKLLQKERFDSHFIACDLRNPDFCKLAESFGAAAYRAKNAAELQTSLEKAFAARKPALVHVPCGEMPSPWPFLHMGRARP